MSESYSAYQGRVRSWFYPIAFVLTAVGLGVLTFQIVHRLSIETVSAKLKSIVETSNTALGLWAREHQHVARFVAGNQELRDHVANLLPDSTGASGPPLPEVNTDSGEHRAIDNCLRPALDSFGYGGYAILEPDGSSVVSHGLDADALRSVEPNSLAPHRSVAIYNGQASNESLVFFQAPIHNEVSRPIASLILAVPAASGLDTILSSADIGKLGKTAIVDAEGAELAGGSTMGLGSAAATARELAGNLWSRGQRDTAEGDERYPLPRVRFSGLDGSHRNGFVGAGSRLDFLDAAVVTLVQHNEVFAATSALKRILFAIFGLGLLGATMNWVYLYRLALLRSDMSDAKSQIQKLGQYHLEEKVGEGGMGVVYRASHSLLQRPTAVKLILPDRASDRTIENFEKEVMLTSRLTHPNTIAIYDYGRTEDGVFYYAMEYLDGINLATLIDNEGPQPWARVVHILRQVCESLAEAHAAGLIHRDIKPENVMLCKRANRHDVVKVLDFGLAGEFSDRAALDAARVQGTPAYMAPESITRPDQIDVRVDIFSVGALGYFLLSGRHIFSGDTTQAILNQQLNSKPIPISQRRPDLPEDLQQLIMDCLAKDPAGRPKNVEDFVQRLDSISSETWTEAEARQGWLKCQDYRPCRQQPMDQTSAAKQSPAFTKTVDFAK